MYVKAYTKSSNPIGAKLRTRENVQRKSHAMSTSGTQWLGIPAKPSTSGMRAAAQLDRESLAESPGCSSWSIKSSTGYLDSLSLVTKSSKSFVAFVCCRRSLSSSMRSFRFAVSASREIVLVFFFIFWEAADRLGSFAETRPKKRPTSSIDRKRRPSGLKKLVS